MRWNWQIFITVELRAMDISVEEIRTDTMAGGRMAFFRDPDDIIIELHE